MSRSLRPHTRLAVQLLAVLALVSPLWGGVLPLHARAAAGPNLITTATTVVSLVAKGDDAAAERYFSPALQVAAPPAKLRQLWQQLTVQLGAFERQTGVQEQTTNGIQSVFVHCLFDRASADVVISFDSSGKVGGLHVANVLPAVPSPTRGTPAITPRAALIRVLTVRPIQASWFAPSFLAVVGVEQIAQGIAGITTELGPYRSLAASPDGNGGYRVRFRDGTVEGRINLDPEGRIAGLTFTNPQLTLTGLQPQGAPPLRAAAVDALLTTRLRRHQFSGAALVAVKGKVVLAKGYGYADAAQERPNTVDTAFRIGSITKQFTALAILELQDAGKLSVHDTLCRYVRPCPAAWAPITLQELLSHTSGIANYTGLPAYSSRMGQPITQAQALRLLKPLPLDFTPGTKFEYSNSNYYLLGYVIEKVSGQTYASYLQQGIFAPLLLRQTGYDANHPDLRTHALGYSSWHTVAPPVDMSWPFAAGALYSSVADLWHWDEALLSDTLISKAATADMFAAHVTTCVAASIACPYNAQTARYGYGWFSGLLGGYLVMDHGGDINGFTAMNEFMPNDGITIVLLSNQANSGASSFLGLTLARIMLGQA